MISENMILSSLTQEELKIVMPYLNLVPINTSERLANAGQEVKYIYFPISGIISFLYVLENGSSAEVGLIGREGCAGVPVLFGGETMPYDIVAQSRGKAYRIPVNKLRQFFNSSAKFHSNLLIFCQAFMTQVSQTAVCNRHHSIEQQLCRWLLLILDRVDDSQLNITQEVIAIMLGVRKEGISEAARRLRDEDIIKYHRGLIQVLNRGKLEQHCCECYVVVRKENERLLPLINKPKSQLIFMH